jgi:hypothetical protein
MLQTEQTPLTSAENANEFVVFWTATGKEYLIVDVTSADKNDVWSVLSNVAPAYSWKKEVLEFMVKVSLDPELDHYDQPVTGVGFLSTFNKTELNDLLLRDFEGTVDKIYNSGQEINYMSDLYDMLRNRK